MCNVFSMNKSEALVVLSEIRDALKKSKVLSCVFLDGSKISHVLTGGYEIKMKCELDNVSRDIINGILKKYELYMKEQNDYVILRSLKDLSLIHISEPTRLGMISYAVFCLK